MRVREAVVLLCSRPPHCLGDDMSIAYGHTQMEGRGLVLDRRSADCSHTVEVYHQPDGDSKFRASLDDPDAVARAAFNTARERWHEDNEIASTVPCDRAGEP